MLGTRPPCALNFVFEHVVVANYYQASIILAHAYRKLTSTQGEEAPAFAEVWLEISSRSVKLQEDKGYRPLFIWVRPRSSSWHWARALRLVAEPASVSPDPCAMLKCYRARFQWRIRWPPPLIAAR